jgi:hypothetical protein
MNPISAPAKVKKPFNLISDLSHIREAIQNIQDYLKGVSYEQVESSKMVWTPL